MLACDFLRKALKLEGERRKGSRKWYGRETRGLWQMARQKYQTVDSGEVFLRTNHILSTECTLSECPSI